MSYERYIGNAPRITITPKGQLVMNRTARMLLPANTHSVDLYYNREERRIGLRASQNGNGDYSLSRSVDECGVISARGFLDWAGLAGYSARRIPVTLEQESGLVVTESLPEVEE